MLRSNFGYNITDDNVMHIDIQEYIESNYDITGLRYTVPTFNLLEHFPGVDLTDIAEINVPINDTNSPWHGIKLKDLLDGDVELDFRQNVLKAFERANFTELQIPLDGPIQQLLKIDMIPRELSHSFTLASSFDQPNGKFGSALGNVALVDCHYINSLFETTYIKYFEDLL